MGNLLASVLKLIGGLGATAGSTACAWVILDEPECPKSLIK